MVRPRAVQPLVAMPMAELPQPATVWAAMQPQEPPLVVIPKAVAIAAVMVATDSAVSVLAVPESVVLVETRPVVPLRVVPVELAVPAVPPVMARPVMPLVAMVEMPRLQPMQLAVVPRTPKPMLVLAVARSVVPPHPVRVEQAGSAVLAEMPSVVRALLMAVRDMVAMASVVPVGVLVVVMVSVRPLVV